MCDRCFGKWGGPDAAMGDCGVPMRRSRVILPDCENQESTVLRLLMESRDFIYPPLISEIQQHYAFPESCPQQFPFPPWT